MGLWSPGRVFTLLPPVLLVVALVVFQADGMPVVVESEAEFNRDIAPFMGGNFTPLPREHLSCCACSRWEALYLSGEHAAAAQREQRGVQPRI